MMHKFATRVEGSMSSPIVSGLARDFRSLRRLVGADRLGAGLPYVILSDIAEKPKNRTTE